MAIPLSAFKPLILFTLIIAVICIALLLYLFFKKKSQSSKYSHYTKRPLLSSAELLFYTALNTTVGSQYRVFTKVSLREIIEVANTHKSNDKQSAFNKIASKSVDFVLTDKEQIDVKIVIELNDSSHERTDRRKRDDFIKKALNDAGIPILFVKVTRQYNTEELKKSIDATIISAPKK